jgi:membrane associated rhomboid family serine protease
MGIYDREYYRREGPSFLETLAQRGQVCKWLVIVNVVAFILQLITKRAFTDFFILDTPKVFEGEIWRLLTYAFLHDEHTILHIIFNMLFLWWFGHEMEELYGRWEFLAFYLVAALVGGLAFTLSWKAGIGPPGSELCLGASGAVTAVMVLFAFHFPQKVIFIFGIVPVPIWLFVLFLVAQDTFGFLSGGITTTAVSVHLGGAAFAALYYQLNWRLLSLWPNIRFPQRQRSRPRLRVFKEDEPETPQPVPVAALPATDVDEQLEAKLDAVLAKVARSGQSSLTESEKQILLRASEIYKKRRS